MAFEGLGGALRKFAADESGSGKPPTTQEGKNMLRAVVIGAGMAGGIISMHGKKEDPRSSGIEMQDRQQLSELIGEIEREAVPIQSFESRDFHPDELKCLTDNVYHEARGEGAEGHYAVIFATLGRVLDKRYPKSICGIVHQPMQFSWTSDEKILAQPINVRDYLKAAIEVYDLMHGRDIASAAVEAGLRAGLPHGAIYYKARNFTGSPLVEKFFARLQRVASIGNHDFYIEKRAPKGHPASEKRAHPKTVPLPAPSPLRQQRQAGRNHSV